MPPRGTRGGWQDGFADQPAGVRILASSPALWAFWSSSTWRQAGAQVTQGSEDRKARETLMSSPQGKRTGAAASSWAPTCCRKKLEEDGLAGEGAPRRLSHCLLTVTQDVLRQEPGRSSSSTARHTCLLQNHGQGSPPCGKRRCNLGTKHGSMTERSIIFNEHLTSTYSAPGTFSHVLPPKLPSCHL